MTRRNDPRLRHNHKMFLKILLANCNFQIVLDEDQAICYLVNYASKAEARPENENDLLHSLVRSNNETEEEE